MPKEIGDIQDYVEAWRIMQQKKPDDYVIATGSTYTVKQFIEEVCKILKIKLQWIGKGMNERAYEINGKKKKLLIKVDRKYFRPLDINYLKGDSAKAKKLLNYRPKYNFKMLVKEMLLSDIESKVN